MMDNKRTVFIVDDDEAIRKCLKDYFELEGFLVIEAKNGFEVERYLKLKKPDYLLLDLFMPEKDGIEMILELKDEGINIIAMSGNPAFLDIAVQLGANSSILKPFSFSTLKKLIS